MTTSKPGPPAAGADQPSAEMRATRESRVPWPDRWLLDGLREAGHPAVDRLKAAPTAWEGAELAGATAEELLTLACGMSGAERADLSGVGPELATMLPLTLALRYSVVPVRRVGAVLELATANPLLTHLERDLAFSSGLQIQLRVAHPAAVRSAMDRIYRGKVSATPTGTQAARIEWVVNEGPAGTRMATSGGTVVESLDRFVADALDQRASDIHFEPNEDGLLVRFRVDGVLHEVTRVAREIAPLVMSRLKILAGLDISDRRRPQDGRASTKFDGRVVDLRISTLPINDRYEKAVVRLLDTRTATEGLSTLGFLPAEMHRVNQLLGQNEGMVLVTGPTGSGKTTTLYSAIDQARSSATNIVTVEDPIEYHLQGINQVQVNERAGLGFAAALRSIVRQDPDVILIGEIRDAETAGIAVKAGLTGHLVLSTLHTIDAPSAISRLADIGVDLGALSGALKGVIAQRLLRRLCEVCAKPVTLAELPQSQQLLLMGRNTDKLRKAVGCEACRGTGFRLRMVVAEVLLVTDELRTAIAKNADRVELQELAKRGGMVPMWEAGIRRVLEGSTALPELLDNVPLPLTEESTNQADVDALLAALLSGGSAKPAAAAPAVAVPMIAAPVAVTSMRPAPSPGTPRVLIAHDDRETRRELRAALEAAGLGVIEAADGVAALNYARRLKPSLVVTELPLPRLDGYALVQAITLETKIPVIAYTGENDPVAHEWVMELGCREVITTAAGVQRVAEQARAMLAQRAAEKPA